MSHRYINYGRLTNTQPCISALPLPTEGKAWGEKQQNFSGSERGYLAKRGKDKFHLLNQTGH